ncbi:GGDEF domain-containing protein [Mycobacterium sp. 236(2023)]|uniref:GGDEF domain-containing protein n=1 Tax=Mycobacterium sp. 236(2023) TaxID=3038163 RepID=UPI002414D8E1|nr:GGDEF domain-containing protein [Mycobacterium sp. 236(2023)]MDG4664411.1 GGDEF domain-containing protein [Mycobacterium sp. 236(2023)]
MAMIASISALVPLTILLTSGSYTLLGISLSVLGLLFAVGTTVFWLTRWPTRVQSEALALSGIAFIAWWSVAQPFSTTAALAGGVLAVASGYLALFHGPRAATVGGFAAGAVAAYTAFRLSNETDPTTATTTFWLMMFPNVAVPVTAAALSRALRIYAMRADEDELTGLFNRRGFVDEVERILHESSQVDGNPTDQLRLAVFMIDIDNFKRINDTYGHAAGDQAILAVAQLLRRQAPLPAVICRSGGEEFLIAAVTRSDTVAMARRICAAVVDLPVGITASIGLSASAVDELRDRDPRSMVAALIADADAAMYEAKRQGGNDVRLAPRCP